MKISIDTRTLKKGEYFVPIKGPNFDGNKFINEALNSGAKGIIKEKDFYNFVKDKLSKTKPTIIAIAGSIGKSTFRSYLCSILEDKFDVLESDLNTKLGFSLKVANELNRQKIIVAEVGIDRIGEMQKTASFIAPDISIITKLGKEHLQFFKSLKNVVIEESNIFKYTKIKDCNVSSNDKEFFKKFGVKIDNPVYFNNPLENKVIENKIQKLLLPEHERDYLRGIYRIVTKHFLMSDKDFLLGLKHLKKPKGRLNVIKLSNKSIVIDDTYNAVCDETIIKGIQYAQDLSKKLNKKLKVVISNMVENGTSSDRQHRNVCKFINESRLKEIYICGNNLKYYKKYIRVKYHDYPTADLIKFRKLEDTLYYIKATRRYKGSELVQNIKKSYG